jgi:hypothetical protein
VADQQDARGARRAHETELANRNGGYRHDGRW